MAWQSEILKLSASDSLRHLSAVCLLLLVVVNFWPTPDQLSEQYLTETMTANLVTYGIARTMNGIISVIQSVEVSVSLGAGVAMQLGQILDPLNDLIERFSGFVLWALAALGVQQLVASFAGSWLMKLMTLAALVAVLVGIYQRNTSAGSWWLRAALLLVLVRFSVIMMVGFVALTDHFYLNERESQARQSLAEAEDQLARVRQTYLDAFEESGILSGFMSSSRQLISTEQQDSLTDKAATAIVQLIVVLVCRSVLIPLLTCWIMWQAVLALTARGQRPQVST
ncbi:MAG: hypothetical protein KDI36_04005 [Pseudomonadales bacterium]|nr:hypothetical protein [Pseudomonadales bacterium]